MSVQLTQDGIGRARLVPGVAPLTVFTTDLMGRFCLTLAIGSPVAGDAFEAIARVRTQRDGPWLEVWRLPIDAAGAGRAAQLPAVTSLFGVAFALVQVSASRGRVVATDAEWWVAREDGAARGA